MFVIYFSATFCFMAFFYLHVKMSVWLRLDQSTCLSVSRVNTDTCTLTHFCLWLIFGSGPGPLPHPVMLVLCRISSWGKTRDSWHSEGSKEQVDHSHSTGTLTKPTAGIGKRWIMHLRGNRMRKRQTFPLILCFFLFYVSRSPWYTSAVLVLFRKVQPRPHTCSLCLLTR